MYRIMLFGTGSGCEKVRRLLNDENVDIIAYIDNDMNKVGKIIHGEEIISPKEIDKYLYDFIIIASQYYQEINKSLKQLRIPEHKIIPFYSYSMERNRHNKLDIFALEKLFTGNISFSNDCNHSIVSLLNKENLSPAKNLSSIIVDIVIPIYNAYEFTIKCIKRVYSNTDVKFNLILINDCSPDKRINMFLRELNEKNTPENLNKLIIVENTENLGFVKTVNKGLSLSNNHVVILNTDTEVPDGWLSRILYPIITKKNISSVTPFTNSGTICSFPKFCEDNELAFDMSVDEIDLIINKHSTNELIIIPTGVGFCMALNRDALNEVGFFDEQTFGTGYGEENDWCMRALKKGYESVLIPNLFVYHKHGASFSKKFEESSRKMKINENIKKVNEKHPEYLSLVNEFIREDPVKPIRDYLISKLLVHKELKKPGILFINHSLGGGTESYQEHYINKIKDNYRVYKFQNKFGFLNLEDSNLDEPIQYIMQFDEIRNNNNFLNILTEFNINLIYINQLITFPAYEMMNLIESSKIPYIYFIHDYYNVCPSYNLINSQGEYCYNETDFNVCQKCIVSMNEKNTLIYLPEEINIQQWRESFERFLSNAKEVIAPSKSTKETVNEYYTNLKISVKEHDIPDIQYSYDPSTIGNPELVVAFIGNINRNKGSKIIYELKNMIEENSSPIKLKVIGLTNYHNISYKSENGILEVTGQYQWGDIPNLLSKLKVNIVIIPAIWPETFSYTTSEAILSGYPVITFNIGAPAERIKRDDTGWVLDEINTTELYKLLVNLNAKRSEIIKKVDNIKNKLKET